MEPLFDNNEEYFKSIFEDTTIHKKPITGIVQGFHILPYILVGPDLHKENSSIKLSGEIKVSPRMIVTIRAEDKNFGEIFEEEEPFMDKEIIGRFFSFSSAKFANMEVKGANFMVEKIGKPQEDTLADVIDALTRKEVINTGVILCPQPKFYPISLEKFIYTILDKEFG